MPYHTHDVDAYRLDYIMAEIDLQKDTVPKSLLGKGSIFAKMGIKLSKIAPYFGLIVAGVVLLVAVLTG